MLDKEFYHCQITILSSVDGVTSKTETKGILEMKEPLILRYEDSDSSVTMTFSDPVTIERKGAYGLYLQLKNGEKTEGKLIFSGNEGSLPIITRNCRFEKNQKGLKFWANYDLDFTHSVQNMRLYLTVQI